MTRGRSQLRAALLALVLCVLASCGSHLQTSDNPLVARTEAGAVSGQDAEGVREWLGIPYAAPPVGDLRWRAPEPAAKWSGLRMASTVGAPCLQAGQQELNPESAEDCLYLNVHRPADDRDDLPVMVWLHGGGLKTGSGRMSVEQAKGLVAHGVVLVSVNYRLGRLGYFAHPALEAEAKELGEEPVANFGLLDQVAALEWVQDNIEDFGGDPDKVTIFGISAGGVSVNYLMSSAKAAGLFDRAIAQSGLGRERPMPWEEAMETGETLAASLDAPDATAATLRELDAADIAKLPAMLLRNEIPIADPVLPKSVAETFASGEEADVPYIVGATDLELVDENYEFLGVDPPAFAANLVAGHTREAAAAYGSRTEFDRHFLNDMFFVEAARNLALAHADDAPTYQYRFGIADPATLARFGGALHGADYPFVFGWAQGAPSVDNADQLADEVSGCWAAFARGDELECGGVSWPEAGEGALLQFTNGGPEAVEVDPWTERLDLVGSIVSRFT